MKLPQPSRRKAWRPSFQILTLMLILSLTIIAWRNSTINPLLNTRWKGLMNIPDPLECSLVFKQDSAIIYLDVTPVETMHYRTNGDTLFLQKLKGGSPCGTEMGAYHYQIKNNLLNLSLIKDECNARAQGFSPEGYQKQ